LALLQAGVSVVPLNSKKLPLSPVLPIKLGGDGNPELYENGKPKHTWKPYQEVPATSHDVQRWRANDRWAGVAMVAGKVSGGLMVLDFDEARFYEAWKVAVGSKADTLPAQQTGGGGYQVMLRCAQPGRNQKLAWIPDEREDDGRAIAIETRGEGGYAVVAPSLHPSGNQYRMLNSDFTRIPLVDDETVQALLAAAKQLDEAPYGKKNLKKMPEAPSGSGESVIDAYNDRVSIHDALQQYGYQQVTSDRYTRGPGHSASVQISQKDGRDFWSVHWSTNDPLEGPYKRTAFNIFCEMEHSGDVKAAVKAAAAELGMSYPTGKHRASTPDQPADGGQGRIPDFDCTDAGNADRLVYWHGNNIRYNGALGWLVWNGSYWKPDETHQIDRLAVQTARAIYREAEQAADTTKQRALSDHARKSQSRRATQDMISLARSLVPIASEALDRNPWLLNVKNGTLDLKTGTLREAQREDYITRQSPVVFDPEAKASRWERFLAEIMPDKPGYIRLLCQFSGYCLTGNTSEECFLVPWGTGRNGKSKFLEAIKRVLGPYAAETAPETLMVKKYEGIPNDLAKLRGARLVTAIETEEGKRLAEARVKQIVGGDTITARFMRHEWFDFKPEFKLILATNHKPQIRGTDPAIWERIHLIPFTAYFAPGQRDTTLSATLEAECSGILNWMLEGAWTGSRTVFRFLMASKRRLPRTGWSKMYCSPS
jgi:P4 family phage/plasmid primase-like protien